MKKSTHIAEEKDKGIRAIIYYFYFLFIRMKDLSSRRWGVNVGLIDIPELENKTKGIKNFKDIIQKNFSKINEDWNFMEKEGT